jgi:hypothetical protein
LISLHLKGHRRGGYRVEGYILNPEKKERNKMCTKFLSITETGKSLMYNVLYEYLRLYSLPKRDSLYRKNILKVWSSG